MDNLHLLLESYIRNVSKHKLSTNNETITQIKSLDYDQLTFVINQLEKDIVFISTRESSYTTLSTNIVHYNSNESYKNYPVHIKQHLDKTELIAITPHELCDAIICIQNRNTMFLPIIAERVGSKYNERRLHAMTLVFDTNKNVVFLHDPNSRSLFNNDDTIQLLQEYIQSVNSILQDYGMFCFTFQQYDFDYMNVNLDFLFQNSIKGNCVVASIVFMILYHNIQEPSYIENILLDTKKDEYRKIYIGFYNTLHDYVKLIL